MRVVSQSSMSMSVAKAIEQVRTTDHMCRANARISGHYSNHTLKIAAVFRATLFRRQLQIWKVSWFVRHIHRFQPKTL